MTVLVAKNHQQARLLQDVNYFRVLGRLFLGEASAGEVAAATGQTVKQAHHKLTRLLAAGLIEVAQERPRAGRPVKVYRPVATEFRIPFALTDAATFADVLRELYRPALELHFEHLGALITRYSDGEMVMRSNDRGGVMVNLANETLMAVQWPEASFSGQFDFRLSRASARELQQRLIALADWVAAEALLPGEEGQNYLLGLLLTPEELL